MTNFSSNTVSVIDITTNQVIATIAVGINPIGVAVTPDGSRVYVAEFTSKGISVIDTEPTSGAFNHVVARVNTDSDNRDVDVSPDGTLAFVTGTGGLTILNIDPDPIAFWHSSNRKAPGLNVAMYSNKTSDTILEEARQTLNPLDRANKYKEFERLVIEDAPIVFLYSPLYSYAQTRRIHGFEPRLISSPASRFADIHSWYIDIRRSISE